MKKQAMAILLACLLAASTLPTTAVTAFADETASSAAVTITEEEAAFYKALNGTWTGKFHVVTSETVKETEEGKVIKRVYFDDPVTMNFVDGPGKQSMYLTVGSCSATYMSPRSWEMNAAGELVFVFNDMPWKATVTLKLENDKTLVGTYEQYGNVYPIQMNKTSITPVNMAMEPQFIFEEQPNTYWMQTLVNFPSYNQPGAAIPFTYELGGDEGSIKLAQQFGLAELTKGKTDVEQMLTLLNLVSDSFHHDGAVALPEQQDALSLVQFAQENNGIECRGLSVILAQMCRAVGIPAKPIMCIPANDPCEDCHVVVHAYSKSLGQWIMLDPTYQVMLQNKDGKYVSLPMLREMLIKGEKLVANSTAGRNSTPFYMDYYRAYMAKNCFRFSSGTNFSYGVEFQTGRKENMLLPKGYQIPFAGYRTETLTTSADAFWAPPPGMPIVTPKAAPASSASSTPDGGEASASSPDESQE